MRCASHPHPLTRMHVTYGRAGDHVAHDTDAERAISIVPYRVVSNWMSPSHRYACTHELDETGCILCRGAPCRWHGRWFSDNDCGRHMNDSHFLRRNKVFKLIAIILKDNFCCVAASIRHCRSSCRKRWKMEEREEIEQSQLVEFYCDEVASLISIYDCVPFGTQIDEKHFICWNN